VQFHFTNCIPTPKKKKKEELIEATKNANSSYIQFLKQAVNNLEMSSAMNFSQLKAFKSVLDDVKK
ncbi:transcriptional regulator ATRX isoform X7, partial [Sigmodon hispidus]